MVPRQRGHPSPISPNTDIPHTAWGQHRAQEGGGPALSPGRCQALGTVSTLRNPRRCAEARCLPHGDGGGAAELPPAQPDHGGAARGSQPRWDPKVCHPRGLRAAVSKGQRAAEPPKGSSPALLPPHLAGGLAPAAGQVRDVPQGPQSYRGLWRCAGGREPRRVEVPGARHFLLGRQGRAAQLT